MDRGSEPLISRDLSERNVYSWLTLSRQSPGLEPLGSGLLCTHLARIIAGCYQPQILHFSGDQLAERRLKGPRYLQSRPQVDSRAQSFCVRSQKYSTEENFSNFANAKFPPLRASRAKNPPPLAVSALLWPPPLSLIFPIQQWAVGNTLLLKRR